MVLKECSFNRYIFIYIYRYCSVILIRIKMRWSFSSKFSIAHFPLKKKKSFQDFGTWISHNKQDIQTENWWPAWMWQQHPEGVNAQ